MGKWIIPAASILDEPAAESLRVAQIVIAGCNAEALSTSLVCKPLGHSGRGEVGHEDKLRRSTAPGCACGPRTSTCCPWRPGRSGSRPDARPGAAYGDL